MMAQGQSDFIQFILIHMKYYTLKQKEKALPVLVLRFGLTTNLLSAYALSFPIHSCLSVAEALLAFQLINTQKNSQLNQSVND